MRGFKPTPSGAAFSGCGSYRYALWRIWSEAEPLVLFVGLNPSTADADTNDPTIRRCIRYARDWGFGGLLVGNLFAFRATLPRDLKQAAKPVGPRNNAWLKFLSRQAGQTVVAWGNDGAYLDRAAQALPLFPQAYCLQINQSGQPAHPLYQKSSVRPILFEEAG